MSYKIMNSVYLFMFLRLNDNRMVKCEVSKFIKIPFVDLEVSEPPVCYSSRNNPRPLYTIQRSNRKTIFYTKNDSVCFYDSQLNDNGEIVPLYDYRRESYYLIKLEYAKTGYIYSIVNYFRASDDNLYFIYLTDRKDDSERDIVIYNYVIYNYHENTIVYREVYQWIGINTLTFKIPIANSFLVSLSRSGYEIRVKIIDLTQREGHNGSRIGSFIISLSDYFANVIDLMKNRVSEADFRMLSKVAHSIVSDYSRHQHEDVKYSEFPDVTIMASIYDKDIVFYKGFQIQIGQVSLKRLDTEIYKALSLSFMFEVNKVVIRVGTGEGGYIVVKGKFIHVPPSVYWTIGEYKISNELNLSSSHLYSVSKVSNDYLIINGTMYYPNPEIPKTYIGGILKDTVTHVYDDEDVSILNVGYDNITAVLDFTRSKLSYKTTIHVTCKSYDKINMINISRLRKNIKQIQKDYVEKPTKIIKVPEELIEEINIDDKVLEVLYKKYGLKPSKSSYGYWYYVDEWKGYMYCLVIYTTTSGDKNVVLFKYRLDDYKTSFKIIGYSQLKSNNLQKYQNLLKTVVKDIIVHQDDNKLHLLELLGGYRGNFNYNYMGDMVIKMKYPLFMLKSIKYNRDGLIKYYNKQFKKQKV